MRSGRLEEARGREEERVSQVYLIELNKMVSALPATPPTRASWGVPSTLVSPASTAPVSSREKYKLRA